MRAYIPVLGLYALVLLASLGLYHTSYATQKTAIQLKKIQLEIASEDQRMTLLKAEWAYLSNPVRIAELSKKHLALTTPVLANVQTPERVAMVLPAVVGEPEHQVVMAQESPSLESQTVSMSSGKATDQSNTRLVHTSKPHRAWDDTANTPRRGFYFAGYQN